MVRKKANRNSKTQQKARELFNQTKGSSSEEELDGSSVSKKRRKNEDKSVDNNSESSEQESTIDQTSGTKETSAQELIVEEAVTRKEFAFLKKNVEHLNENVEHLNENVEHIKETVSTLSAIAVQTEKPSSNINIDELKESIFDAARSFHRKAPSFDIDDVSVALPWFNSIKKNRARKSSSHDKIQIQFRKEQLFQQCVETTFDKMDSFTA